ncbi:MAG: signal recognition particle-docking protein FtsY [Pseudomonadota bacterium]|nr:signal recognition particle-docking protein FtsY [Pseudomonadota bacterium]
MSFLSHLKSGLAKSSSRLSDGIAGIFTKTRLGEASLEQLEDVLIEADFGAKMAAELVAALAKQKFDKDISPQEVREFLAAEIAKILEPPAQPLVVPAGEGTKVVMMVGVNGNGKTTTIGKLAAQFKTQGFSVMLAAGDTFRAAAVEQLQVWGERSQIPVVTGVPGSDPASLAYRAYEQARAQRVDVLFIDTAGRLQNKANLMAELQKISRVLKKIDASAPHHVIQVLDATTGQNAISQVQAFKELAQVTGLIITKLDGTAKGGIVVALARQFGLPIHAIGVGEGIEDLEIFRPTGFARNLLSPE